MLLLTLRGTPTIYQGEELGLTDVSIPPERVQDPWEKNVPGLGLGRDPVRTPMPWDGSATAGFTTGEPWLPIGTSMRPLMSQPKRTILLQCSRSTGACWL
jgi:alpha-glucosidase